MAGLLGGFLIDFDHALEYLLVLGPHFNFIHFFQGREFLTSDKIYIIWHAWEWLPILLAIAWLARKRTAIKIFFIMLALAAAVHLFSDVLINQYPLKFYSILYRQSVGWSAPKLLSPEQYRNNLELKGKLGI